MFATVKHRDFCVPEKAAARLIVPGYKDLANLKGELRRDSPTGSRIAQHIILSLGGHYKHWSLLGADVRAAFLNSHPYVSRELYISAPDGRSGPTVTVPLGEGCLAKVLKGVFGLADAPREWYLRLARELKDEKWQISAIDGALWYYRGGRDGGELKGAMVGHVDDLLFLGDQDAKESLLRLGKTLGFGSIEEEDFQWCGKRIRRDPTTKELVISMQPYHAQLTPVVMSRERRKQLDDPLTAYEVKKLKGILGSLQWLVAQLRFDIAFQVSSLQGETPAVGTMLRANKALQDCKKDGDFEIRFKDVNPYLGGILSVTDAALGNVDENGSPNVGVGEKVHSQSCYAVLLADETLVGGKKGSFNLIDFRSHRLQRVCRSSYASETLGVEEGFDAAELCRGFLAEAIGINVSAKSAWMDICKVPLVGVTDAKDTYDRVSQDTGFGNGLVSVRRDEFLSVSTNLGLSIRSVSFRLCNSCRTIRLSFMDITFMALCSIHLPH